MRKRHVLLVAASLLSLAAASTLWARRLAPVSARCPADAPQREIDAKGLHDVCTATTVPLCPSGLVLEVDRAGQGDMCEAGQRRAKPTCPRALRLEQRAGVDNCTLSGPPRCPSGSRLTPLAGEDMCVF